MSRPSGSRHRVSKFERVFKSLPNLGRKFQYRRYTIENRSHTLWFSLFLVAARRSSVIEADLLVPAVEISNPAAANADEPKRESRLSGIGERAARFGVRWCDGLIRPQFHAL